MFTDEGMEKENYNLLDKNYVNDHDYTLHSLVIHQGSANSGHYYAFIRP